MDPELREALSSINGSIADLRTDMNARHDKTTQDVLDLRRDVFGSSTPPGANGAAPVAKQASSAALEVAAHAARLVSIETELQKQSKAMGIGIQGLRWAVTKDGRDTLVRFASLVGVLYITLKAAGVIK